MNSRALSCFAAAGLLTWCTGCGPRVKDGPRAASETVCGLGLSAVADPHQAGMRAAKQAVSALGSGRIRCALVFENVPPKDRRLVLAGVASQVPAEAVFGCSAAGVATSLGAPKRPAVAVLALGGEGWTTAAAITDLGQGDPRLSGEMIARALPRDRRDGFLLLLADCDAPDLAELVAGVKGVQGANETIVGAAAGGEQRVVYFRGRPLEKTALGVTLKGPFRHAVVSRSAGSATAHTEDGVTATAREAGRALVAELQAPPTFVLAFSSVARRAALKDPTAEVVALLDGLGSDVPVLGVYGPGQIGPPRTGMPALGLERHVILSGVRWHGAP